MAELYRLDFPSGKSYVGITSKTAAGRFKDHLETTRYNGVFAVNHALRKHGASSVVVNTLAIGSWQYVKDAEVKAIKVFNTKSPNGYNLTNGGDGVVGNVLSDETKALLSKMNLGKLIPNDVREKISLTMHDRMSDPQVRKHISDKLRNKFVSEDTRKKLSDAARRRYEDTEQRELSSQRAFGRVVSQKTRDKLSKSLTAYNARKIANAS